MPARLRLRDLLASGVRSLSRYTGTLLAVHVVQLLLTAVCMLAVAIVLAQTFAHLPLWDEAVDGDLVAMIECLRYGKTSFLATGGIIFGVIVVWQLVSWFLVGGLYGVLAQRPEGRGAVARCFGATGASTYLAYARLAVIQLPALAFVMFVLGTGIDLVTPHIEQALTLPELFGPLILAVLPALLLLHYFWTVTDYARVDLTLRQRDAATKGDEAQEPGVLVTYVRTLGYVARRPITLVHGGFGWVLWILVTLAYAYVANGRPMYGAEGAVTLFVARQGIALLRSAIRCGILGGQIELGRARPLPPRRVEAKLETA